MIKIKYIVFVAFFGLGCPVLAVDASPNTEPKQAKPINGYLSKSPIKELAGKVLIDAQLEVTQPLQVDKYLNFVNISTPTLTPASGHSLLFANSGANQMIAKWSDGSTTILGSGSGSSGDITDDVAGLGLTGGGTSGSVTLFLSTPIANSFLDASSVTKQGNLINLSTLQTNLNSVGVTTGALTNQFSSLTTTYLTLSSATATYEQPSQSAALYLTQSSATATYLNVSSAPVTYLFQSSATATYLFNSSATATYLFNSSATATYLTQSSATATYCMSSGANCPNGGNPGALSSTQTWTGGNTFQSSTTVNGIYGGDGSSYLSGFCYNLQYASTTSPTSTTSGSFVATNLVKSITLHSTLNKVRITVGGTLSSSTNAHNGVLTVFAGTARNLAGTDGIIRALINTGTGFTRAGAGVVIMDSPLTTGSTTYTVSIRRDSSGTIVFPDSSMGTMTLEECTP